MAVTFKALSELEKRIWDSKSKTKAFNSFAPISHEEVLRILWCARKYKEMMREFNRYFKQHSIASMSELAKKLAEIEK